MNNKVYEFLIVASVSVAFAVIVLAFSTNMQGKKNKVDYKESHTATCIDSEITMRVGNYPILLPSGWTAHCNIAQMTECRDGVVVDIRSNESLKNFNGMVVGCR